MKNDSRLKLALLIGAVVASVACWYGSQTAHADDQQTKGTLAGVVVVDGTGREADAG